MKQFTFERNRAALIGIDCRATADTVSAVMAGSTTKTRLSNARKTPGCGAFRLGCRVRSIRAMPRDGAIIFGDLIDKLLQTHRTTNTLRRHSVSQRTLCERPCPLGVTSHEGAGGASMASGCSFTTSLEKPRIRSTSPPVHRKSVRMLRPSVHPSSRSPSRNVATQGLRLGIVVRGSHQPADPPYSVGLLRARPERRKPSPARR
jgi:hypothetical protein